MRHWGQRVLNFVFPSTCDGCEAALTHEDLPFFCRPCWEGIRPITGSTCSRCGIPGLHSRSESDASELTCCHTCYDSPPRYDKATALFRYEGVLAQAVQRMKYKSQTSLISPLANLLCENLQGIDHMDIVLPVPLHVTRLRKREFNQSLALAKRVAQTLHIPLSMDNLARTRKTPPQTTLEWKDRQRNVRDSFSVRRPHDFLEKKLLLVDDVLTTGATVNECARVLRAAGAESIQVLALARTIAD